ncbi:hypothetical protein MMC07_000505 [Pseudocyphellaria aurata]|nr:hypothetical protein [Pseudocyphellaria aurata]
MTSKEWLFEGARWDIVRLLARPVLPSCNDRVLNHALTRSRDNVRSTTRLLPSTSRRKDFRNAIHQKRQRVSNADLSHEKRRKLSQGSQEVLAQGKFLTLPAELIAAVFDQLCIDDALHLVLAAQLFWKIGWPYIEKKLMEFMAPWAGHRLVCMDRHYYPSALSDHVRTVLNAEEDEDLKQYLIWADLSIYECIGPRAKRLGTPSPFAARSKYWTTGVDDAPPHFTRIRRTQDVARREMRKIGLSVTWNLPNYFPDDRKWVLRNLTSREFVRSEVLAGSTDQNGPFFKDLGFEHIVLSRIFTSTRQQLSTLDGVLRERGTWSGDRFEIVTLDHHVESASSDEPLSMPWTDISEDAVEDLIQFWRAHATMSDDLLKRLDARFNGRMTKGMIIDPKEE